MGNFVIKSVSIPQNQAEFLDKNPELSLSKIIQERIKEIINQKVVYENKLRVYENKINGLIQTIQSKNDEIEKLKLLKS